MRVAILSATCRAGDAIGNQIADKAAFFRERGADVADLLLEDREVVEDRRDLVRVADAAVERVGLAVAAPRLVGGARQRERVVSASLRAYAAMATSADTGAVRDVSKLAGGN